MHSAPSHQRLQIADVRSLFPGGPSVGGQRADAVGAQEVGLAAVGRRRRELVDGDLARDVLAPQVLQWRPAGAVFWS